MNKLRNISIILLLLLLGSCAQKYDDSGYVPLDPNEIPTTDTVTVKLHPDLGDISKAFVTTSDKVKYKSYIGAEVEEGDTLKSAQSLFKLNLEEADTTYQKIVLFLPLNPNTDVDTETTSYNLGLVKSDFKSDSTAEYLQTVMQDTIFIKNDTFVAKADSLDELTGPYAEYNFYVRWEIDNELIRDFLAEDSEFTGIFINSNNTDRVYEIQNEIDHEDVLPLMRKYSLVLDDSNQPLTATDGTDSLEIASSEEHPITDFVSLTSVKEQVNDDEELIRIGGLSGDKHVLRFNFQEAGLDSNTTLLTVRFVMEYAGSDDKYGILPTVELVPVDTTWNVDAPEEIIENELFDTFTIAEFAVKTIKDGVTVDPEVGDRIYLSSINTLFSGWPYDYDKYPGWLKNPASNKGFVLRAQNSDDYLTFSDFINPRFEITYINEPEVFEE